MIIKILSHILILSDLRLLKLSNIVNRHSKTKIVVLLSHFLLVELLLFVKNNLLDIFDDNAHCGSSGTVLQEITNGGKR